METRIVDHHDGHIDTETLIDGVWVVTKCNIILGEDAITQKLRGLKGESVKWVEKARVRKPKVLSDY